MLLAVEIERVLQHIPDGDVSAIPQPFADGFLPGIGGVALRLLRARKCFERFRFESPLRARLVLLHGFGPELVAYL